jgi:eukaryotic-like serine/threonine-protein kinase
LIAGRYALDREIGRGGMGAVWLARDEVLGRSVAIKRIGLMPGADSPDLARAEREARLAAMLNHPHVVAVFDLVERDDQHWLVMEYVAGQSLAQLVSERGPLPDEQVARLMWQVSDALAAAHGAGIVHRDVKPSNILVTADGQAKLTDFGIARAEADASLTRTGLVTGSPAYIAPEVASGSTADGASDVWSLGATLYHALAGRAPYDVGDNLVGALYRIVHEDPPRLPEAGALGALLEVTMAREPANRWTMEEVRDHLARLVRSPHALEDTASPTVVLRPAPAPTARTTPPVRSEATPAARERGRRPYLLPVAAGLAALLVLAVILAITLGGEEETPPTASETSASSGSSSSPSERSPSSKPSEDKGDDAAQTRRELQGFVSDYLGLVTSDRRTAFSMLTPEFQAASGGFAGYDGFWSTVAEAKLLDVQADPEELEVSYQVRYRKTDGSVMVDDVSLQLVRQDDGYLIADEA